MAESNREWSDLRRDSKGDLIPYQVTDDSAPSNKEETTLKDKMENLYTDSPSIVTDCQIRENIARLAVNDNDILATNLYSDTGERMRLKPGDEKVPNNQPKNGYHLQPSNTVTSSSSQRSAIHPHPRTRENTNTFETGTSLDAKTSLNRLENQQTADHGPPPRYPDYSDIRRRKDTFILPQGGNSWPHGPNVQDIDNLSRHGFFYTGKEDLIRCHQCGLGLKDWTREDDPLFVHLKYGPSCLHLKRNTDRNLLRIYQRHIEESGNRVSRLGASDNEIDDIRHPEYQTYEVRLASYTNWPRERRQTPAQLAKAGFFHTGLRDVVRCFACDGGLQSWDSGDEPWIEHARLFSHCPHVRREKGNDYIRMVLASNDVGLDDPEIEEQETEMVYPLFSRVAQEVMEIGYSRAAVAMAIEECKQKNVAISQDTIVNILLDKQERGETLPEDTIVEEPQIIPEFKGKSREELVQEREYYRKRISCIGCDENECNILFLPCGHHKMCEICARDINVCCLCSEKIVQKVKTFMS